MKGAIMQPTLFPWLGYFAMIDSVEKFVFLDNVQLEKRSWQVRNRIKMDGREKMLTIPIVHKERSQRFIYNTMIVEDCAWKRKHLEIIRHCYKNAPYFDEVYKLLCMVYEMPIQYIGDFNIECIKQICQYIGIHQKFVRSSEIDGILGKKDGLLADICQKEGIDVYLSARGSAVYIEREQEGGVFTEVGIHLEYQNYVHPEYMQQGGQFIPYMGIIDLLFNEGKRSLEIIKSGCRQPLSSRDVGNF